MRGTILIPSSRNMTAVKACKIAALPKRSVHRPESIKEKFGDSYPADPVVDYDEFVLSYGLDIAVSSFLRGRTPEFTSNIMDFLFAVYHYMPKTIKPLYKYSKYWLVIARPALAIFFEDFQEYPVQQHPNVVVARSASDIDWDRVKSILVKELGSKRGETAYEYLTSPKYTGSHIIESFGLVVILDMQRAFPLTKSTFIRAFNKPVNPPSWARVIRILEDDLIDDLERAADIVLTRSIMPSICQ